ncbi:MAG: FeoB-associated Cys-rich membrane protein [Bacteroidota bacterium]
MNWQEITVLILVLASLAFIARRIYRSAAAKGCAKECGCNGLKSSQKT